MHTVDRGPEPAGLEQIRKRLTPGWVRYYREKKGKKPTDARWQEFQPAVRAAFFDLCAYCEQICKGEVEHFRSKSRFPERVYQWSNWLHACHTCNQAKGGKWPRGGYVDPCAASSQTRPEAHFDFDTKTAEIVPRSNVTPTQRRRAQATIRDLRLNEYHHLKARKQWLEVVEWALGASPPSPGDPRQSELVKYLASRERAFSSIIRKRLGELGCQFSGD